MATHAQNIANLRNAVYGEQVRGSMIELFEEDYNLVKDGVGVGTDVTSSASSTTGWSDGAVYINNSTWHLFKLEGTAWADKGVIQGAQGASVSGAVDNGDGTFYLTLSDGTRTSDIATIQGIQGPTGPQGPAGSTGPAGRSVTSITMSGTGKSHPVTATYSDGSTQLVGTVQDGADGQGTGDMSKSTYDPNDHGYVDAAAGVTNGTNTLSYSTLNGKADAATTLSGYGIADAYTKTETDDKFMGLPSSSVTSGKVATSDGSGGFTWATPSTGVTTYAALTDTDVSGAGKDSYMKYSTASSKWIVDNDLKSKVINLDSSGKLDYSNVKNSPSGVLTIQKNGTTVQTFAANATSNVTANLVTDNWHTTTATVSSNQVTFSNVDDSDNNGYDVYFVVTSSSTNKNPSATLNTVTGEGTSSMTLVYDTDADAGATAKLRIIK